MASSTFLSFRNVLFHNGSLHGIAGSTAVFDLNIEGDADLSSLPSVTSVLWEQYPLPFFQQVWLRRAVREQGDLDIGSWVAALVVALQWQAGEGVGPARVVSLIDGKFTIAAPWERRDVFNGALSMATRMLTLWLRKPVPSDEACARLLVELDEWLAKVRPGPMHSNAQRLVIAARARNVPVEVLVSDGIEFGWGQARRKIIDTTHVAGLMSVERLSMRSTLARAGFNTIEAFAAADVASALHVAQDRPFPMHVSAVAHTCTDWTLPLVRNAAELESKVTQLIGASRTQVLLQMVPQGQLYHFICVQGRLVLATTLVELKLPTPGHGWKETTQLVHPSTRMLVERQARVLALDVVMIAMQVRDITQPLDIYTSNPGTVSDCITLRHFPEYLFRISSIDLAWLIVSSLLDGKSGRLPLAAVAGSFGAATTSRMLVSIWIAAGKKPGLASPSALFVGSEQISQVALAPEQSARALFAQRDVEAVVFEVPEAGLSDNGNPCDHYDVAALLNFQAGAAAQRGPEVIARLLAIKGVPLEAAATAVVLNAEDDAVMSLVPRFPCRRRVLVSSSATEGSALKDHLGEGGEAVVLEQREGKAWIMLLHGRSRSPVVAVEELPSSAGGTIQSIVKQALFATALGIAHDLPNEVIRRGLIAFSPEA